MHSKQQMVSNNCLNLHTYEMLSEFSSELSATEDTLFCIFWG